MYSSVQVGADKIANIYVGANQVWTQPEAATPGGGGGGGIAGALHSYDAQTVADAGTADLDQVELWEDQGSGGIDAVSYLGNTSNDPEFIASGINGLPSLRFEFSERLRIPITGPITQPTTIIAVVQKSDTRDGYISTGPNWTQGNRNDILYNQGSATWKMSAGSFADPSPTVPVVGGEPQIVMAVFNGSDSRFWINGAWTGGLNAGTNDLDDDIWLGTNWDQDSALHGLMAEWHLVPEAWDQTQCDDVGAGLATKYGITLT